MKANKNKTIIIASESPDLYTSKRLLMEAKKLKYSTVYLNPYQFMLAPDKTTASQLNDKEGSLYFHRTTGIRYDDFDQLVALHHEQLGFRITNPLAAGLNFRDKEHQTFFFRKNNLPGIDSICYRGPLNEKYWDSILSLSKKEKYIIKMSRGNQGIGVNLVNGTQSLKSFLETFHAMKDQRFIIQPFIEHKKEWRVFVINNQIAGIVERSLKSDDFRGNSKRSNSKSVKKISAAMEEEILRGVKLSGLDYCGVDVMNDGDNFYFLEFNPVPGFLQLEELSAKNIARELLLNIRQN